MSASSPRAKVPVCIPAFGCFSIMVTEDASVDTAVARFAAGLEARGYGDFTAAEQDALRQRLLTAQEKLRAGSEDPSA